MDIDYEKLCMDNNFKKKKNQTYEELWISKQDIICESCEIKKGSQNTYFNQVLCRNCTNIDEYKMMYKTTAINEYFLNQSDLDDLDCFKIKNKLYSSKSSYIYRKTDIIDKFCQKYNTNIANINNQLEILTEIKNKRKHVQNFNLI
jgi:hypothetical protein